MIHIRIQQRRQKKYITIIEGLPNDLDLKLITNALKKVCNCSGTIIESEFGKIIQLQGDCRQEVLKFLKESVEIEKIIVHGF